MENAIGSIKVHIEDQVMPEPWRSMRDKRKKGFLELEEAPEEIQNALKSISIEVKKICSRYECATASIFVNPIPAKSVSLSWPPLKFQIDWGRMELTYSIATKDKQHFLAEIWEAVSDAVAEHLSGAKFSFGEQAGSRNQKKH